MNSSADMSSAAKNAHSAAPPFDGQLDEDLRNARRLLQCGKAMLRSHEAPAALSEWSQFHLEEAKSETNHAQRAAESKPADRKAAGEFAWWCVRIGVMAVGCGAGMLGISYTQARPELWTGGLLAALCGQFFLVLGLALPGEHAAKSIEDKSAGKTRAADEAQSPPWSVPLPGRDEPGVAA